MGDMGDIARESKRAEQEKKEKETVNHPSHYNAGRIEVIDAIEDWGLDFCAGNVVKYVARHQRKGEPLDDLKKARFYIDRLIERIENGDKGCVSCGGPLVSPVTTLHVGGKDVHYCLVCAKEKELLPMSTIGDKGGLECELCGENMDKLTLAEDNKTNKPVKVCLPCFKANTHLI